MESPMTKMELVCSYGGKIQLSSGNGSLKYVGGETRIIAVPQSVTFAELSLKLAEMCGGSLVSLRCKLPNEDLDFLITISSGEELQNLAQLYQSQAPKSTELKIKSFLSTYQPKIKTIKSLAAKKKLKFVCSYGGKLQLSSCDGSLRYKVGETRIIAVPVTITFAELSLKLAEIYGGSLVTLRCKLPNEDLDILITVKSDEELQNVVQIYASQASDSTEIKIKAFLSPWQPKNKTVTKLPPPKNKSPPVLRPTATSSSTTIAGNNIYKPAVRSSRTWQPKNKTVTKPPPPKNKSPPVLRPTATSSSTTIAGNNIYKPAVRSSRTRTKGAEGMAYYRVPVSYQQPRIIMKTGYNYTGGFPQHHINPSRQFGLAC